MRGLVISFSLDQIWSRSFLVYLVVGGITFVVDAGLLRVLKEHLGVPLNPSVVVAFVAGLVVHFSLNKYWSFKSHERAVLLQIRTYLAVAACSMLLTLLIINLCVYILGIHYMVAKVVAVGATVVWGYLCNRYMTFGRGMRASIHLVYQAIVPQRRDLSFSVDDDHEKK